MQPNAEQQYQIDIPIPEESHAPGGDLQALRRRYAGWASRGGVQAGRRVTIMTETTHCAPGTLVRVDHVLEIVEPGHELYVMGPKPVWSEFVNGQRQGQAVPGEADPFAPAEYDGRVLDSPGIDVNFAPTYYRFPGPGRYEICWQPGAWRSNRLVIVVAAPAT